MSTKADDAATRAMALNYAAYNDASVRALGVATFQTPWLWWREPGGSSAYLAALILDPATSDAQVLEGLDALHQGWGGRPLLLYDTWATRDLTAAGYERRFQTPWYLRRAAPIAPARGFSELSIEIVTTSDQLADFERAARLGFEHPPDEPAERFGQHAEATLDDPGMFYLNARISGEVVASTAAYATDDMLGIYSISTLPEFRRRGYGTELVRAAVALRPDLPVSVYPDPPSVPMYTGFGFFRAREMACWERT